ncbi:MAG: hypothetical protein V7K21_00365 [Nostoc sp.]
MCGEKDAIASPPNVKMGVKDFKSSSFIVECPYPIAQVLDAEFLPDAIDL